jgi:membrane protease YdiL (CAAX protease family)
VLAKCARGALWSSVVLICALTFVWPFLVSRDPDQPAFKLAAIAALLLFFLSMSVLLAGRLRERR